MVSHYTARSLAEHWDTTPKWVTDQARKGNIPGAWKLGHQWRFDPEQIESYEQGQRTTNIFALTPGALRRQQQKRTA